MKKFLMYVIVLVGILFIGYTTYYFVRNNETISLALAENESVYINKGETYELPIKWTKPYSSTKLEVKILNEQIVSYEEETKLFTGISGGITTVVITPTNENFGPFRFDIHVGDGSMENPYIIQTAIELSKIGNDEKYTLDKSYILIKDLDLKAYENWSPIGSRENPFTGVFDGNGKSISNMKITAAVDAGLFGAIAPSAQVTGIVLNDCIVSGSFENAGAIAGKSKGIIRLCKVNNLTLENDKDNSNNGGVVGYMENNSADDNFVAFGYIDLTSVRLSAKVAGNFGGIVGYMAGSVVINSKAHITNYTTLDNSLYFGSVAGIMQDAINSTKYTFSVVKKVLTITETMTITNSSTSLGALVGVNKDRSLDGHTNIIKSCYYNNQTDLNVIATSSTTINTSGAYKRELSELKEKETFVDWNFETIWTTYDNTVVCELNFDSAEVESLDEYIPGAKVYTADELWEILGIIRKSPNSGITYVVSKNDVNQGTITLDLTERGAGEWETIAKFMAKPITCSIICDEDVKIVIKNGGISGNNSSFFGYISGANTKFNNITFENIEVNSTEENIGVVATMLLDNACLDNIIVKDSNVTGNDETYFAAIICAKNFGRISNCKAISTNDHYVQTSCKSASVGGISATTSGYINNAIVDSYRIKVLSTLQDASAFVGGISATCYKGAITNSYFYGSIVNEEFVGDISSAGIVAKLSSGTKVEKCLAETQIKTRYTNDSTVVAGLVAYSEGGEIVASYFSGDMVGYYAAGICDTNSGTIDQCYAKGEFKGIVVSGLVNFNKKSIADCYVLGNVTGLTSNSISNGICYTLPVDSSVQHCFVNVSYANGQGKKNAETNEEFRATVEKVGQLFGLYPDTGTLTNCIVINYEDAEVKYTFFGIKPGWIGCSNDEACGATGDYTKFKNEAKFDQTVWEFDPNTNDGYPYLKNTPKV